MTPNTSYPDPKTCRNGHPWETSAYTKKDGKRFCKICNYARKKEKIRENIKQPDRILTALERFEKRLDKTPGHGRDGDCWIWTAGTTNGGYGMLAVNGGQVRTHRFAWELENGPIPNGMQILHHCDNPPCCRVSHLFLGYDADNVADKIAKGRGPDMKSVSLYRQNPVGERNGRAILTWEIVRSIRDDRESFGLSLSELANKYDTSIRTVSRIVNNKNWKEENL